MALALASPPVASSRAPDNAGNPLVIHLPGEDAPIAIPRQTQNTLSPELRSHGELSSEERQQRFVNTLLPLILTENARVLRERRSATMLLKRLQRGRSLRQKNAEWLQRLAADYGVTGDPLSEAKARQELLLRVDVIPPSLALAQAAIETGWGSSKAAQRDRNLFGMIGVVATSKKSKARRKGHGGRTSRLRFAHLADSVQGYVRNLNSHSAYKMLRALRAKARARGVEPSGSTLTAGLTAYSELGKGYVKLIKTAIHGSDLARYDLARLGPALDLAPEIASESPAAFGPQAYARLEDSSTL